MLVFVDLLFVPPSLPAIFTIAPKALAHVDALPAHTLTVAPMFVASVKLVDIQINYFNQCANHVVLENGLIRLEEKTMTNVLGVVPKVNGRTKRE